MVNFVDVDVSASELQVLGSSAGDSGKRKKYQEKLYKSAQGNSRELALRPKRSGTSHGTIDDIVKESSGESSL